MESTQPWFTLPVSRWSDRAATAGLQARAEATRHELILAAARRFASQGYHATSLVQVVEDCGHRPAPTAEPYERARREGVSDPGPAPEHRDLGGRSGGAP